MLGWKTLLNWDSTAEALIRIRPGFGFSRVVSSIDGTSKLKASAATSGVKQPALVIFRTGVATAAGW